VPEKKKEFKEKFKRRKETFLWYRGKDEEIAKRRVY